MSREERLGAAITEVESLCEEYEEIAERGETPPPDLVKKRTAAHESLKAEVDHWIGRMDASKAIVAIREERYKRLKTALNTARRIQAYISDVIHEKVKGNPEIVFRGNSGCLYLHKNPKAVKIDFATDDKTVYKVIDKTLIDMEPSLNAFVKAVTHYVIDHEALRAALDRGDAISWARYEQGHHVRVKA
jgi:hypothetical protein